MGALGIYLKSFLAWRAEKYAAVPPLDLLRYFTRWRAGFAPGSTPLGNQLPWLTFAAVDFLGRNVGPRDTVFEWGMGGSSLFLARRAAHVVSIEHESAWFEITRAEIARREIANWEGFLVAPDPLPTGKDLSPSDPAAYYSSQTHFAGNTFRDYASFIDRYPDRHFDIVLIDGRVRPSCVRHAIAKARRIIVIDNAERRHYHPSYRMLREAGWTPRALAGPAAHVWTRNPATP